MPEPDLWLLFIRPLNQLAVRYMVSGSVAAIFYGEPRVTHDVDFVVFLRSNDIARLQGAFHADQFYVPPVEVIAGEIAREQRGHFNLIHMETGFKADFYTAGRDEFHAWAFRNAKRREFRGEPLVLAPSEYVIVRKLEYFREGGSDKHLRDIRSMLAVSRDQIDHEALHDWIHRRGVEAQWQSVEA